MEETKGRPARKVNPDKKEKQRVRVRSSNEQTLIRYANIYMLAGIIIGACVFYFLIAPGIKKEYLDKINEMDRTYSSTIASRNSEIDNLSLIAKTAEDKAAVLEEREEGYQKTIDRQKDEIQTLKEAVEAGGGEVVVAVDEPEEPEEPDETGEENMEVGSGVGHNIGQVVNAAAERNNENVRGISREDIEMLIQGE